MTRALVSIFLCFVSLTASARVGFSCAFPGMGATYYVADSNLCVDMEAVVAKFVQTAVGSLLPYQCTGPATPFSPVVAGNTLGFAYVQNNGNSSGLGGGNAVYCTVGTMTTLPEAVDVQTVASNGAAVTAQVQAAVSQLQLNDTRAASYSANVTARLDDMKLDNGRMFVSLWAAVALLALFVGIKTGLTR
jgi:hypothetical protein